MTNQRDMAISIVNDLPSEGIQEYALKVYIDNDTAFSAKMGGTLAETQIAMAGATIAFKVMGYGIFSIKEEDGSYRGIKLMNPRNSIRMEIERNTEEEEA